jgi:transposase
MGNGSGVSRGDRNRNARLARLRILVPVTNAIVGIDLAEIERLGSLLRELGHALGRTCRSYCDHPQLNPSRDIGVDKCWTLAAERASGVAGATVRRIGP